jgi:uncharacterized membrane protein
MAEIGPVQLVVVGFGPNTKFEGRVLEELEKLEQRGITRILDLLFVSREEDGDIVALDHQGPELGGIVGAILGFEFDGPADASTTKPNGERTAGLSLNDVRAIAESIEPGTAVAFLLIEHVWARDLKIALRATGGVPLAEGFLTPEAVASVLVELSAMSAELDHLEKEVGVRA